MEKLKTVIRELKEIAKPHKNSKRSALFTTLFNMLTHDNINMKEKKIIWKKVLEYQYLTGKKFALYTTDEEVKKQ